MNDENTVGNEIEEDEMVGTLSDPNAFAMIKIPITENYSPSHGGSVCFMKENGDNYLLILEVDGEGYDITLSRIELRKIQKAIEVVLSPEFMDEA